MQIDIYCHTRNRFIAVRHKHAAPESWAGAKLFKSIELGPEDVRYGIVNAAAVLATIEQEGYAVI